MLAMPPKFYELHLKTPNHTTLCKQIKNIFVIKNNRVNVQISNVKLHCQIKE